MKRKDAERSEGRGTGQPDPREFARRLRQARPWIAVIAALTLSGMWYAIFGDLLHGGGADRMGLVFGLIFGLFFVAGFVASLYNLERIIRLAESGRLPGREKQPLPGRGEEDIVRPETAPPPRRRARSSGGGGIPIGWILLVVICVAAAAYIEFGAGAGDRESASGSASRQSQAGRQGRSTTAPSREEAWQAFVERVRSEPSPCPVLLARMEQLVRADDVTALNRALREALECKIRRPSYQEAKAARDRLYLLDLGQPFPEERLIRRLRDRLVLLRAVPEGVEVRRVPAAVRPPVIDGKIGEKEWTGALEVPVRGTRVRLRLLADPQRLYLALSVPEENSADNYSSLQVIWHQGLSPWLKQAYQFVYGRGYANSGCRISGVKWPDPPPPGGFPRAERWKKYRLNECGLFTGSRGASSLSPYRIYEFSLDRHEAGLPSGHPFPLRLVVETAPGQERQRNYVGPLRPSGEGWTLWVSLP